MRLLGKFLVLLALGAIAPACGAKKPAASPLEYAENAKIEYDLALKAFFDKDWDEAALLFKEVKRKYGYSRYARLADLRLADIEFKQEKYAEAISAYKGFVHDYPNDPEVPYARYRVAKALFEQSSPTLPISCTAVSFSGRTSRVTGSTSSSTTSQPQP